jgi:hypothetical protein
MKKMSSMVSAGTPQKSFNLSPGALQGAVSFPALSAVKAAQEFADFNAPIARGYVQASTNMFEQNRPLGHVI